MIIPHPGYLVSVDSFTYQGAVSPEYGKWRILSEGPDNNCMITRTGYGWTVWLSAETVRTGHCQRVVDALNRIYGRK
jgi:hypothetical protein